MREGERELGGGGREPRACIPGHHTRRSHTHTVQYSTSSSTVPRLVFMTGAAISWVAGTGVQTCADKRQFRTKWEKDKPDRDSKEYEVLLLVRGPRPPF